MKMKEKILPLLLCAVVCAACDGTEPNNTDKEGTVLYAESNENFANPERGLYTQMSFHSENNNSLSVSTVKNLYRQGQTLILTMYYLTDFVTSDISDAYLQRLETNMQALREGGAKCVLRFAYSNNETQKPWDASSDWVLRHIEQVAPYLQEYSDVILCWQAGFVGVWGEWYYTENFIFNPSTDDQFALRRGVLDAELRALPATRMVCVRTPEFKLRCFNISVSDSITQTTAYNQSDLSRIGGHNDCFLASSNDVGTFDNNIQRAFWKGESRYTVMGGETCGTSPCSVCDNAVKQMENYHWTYLNKGYHQQVISSWRIDGCMDEITRRLGYRLVLTKGWFTQQPKAAETFEADLQIKNVGFAAPVNPRDVQLVFVSKTDSLQKYVYDFDKVEPRNWFAGGLYEVNLNCTLDAKMSGTYTVYLNLPDPEETLANRVEYSIRLANKDMWEATTGYNKLCEINVK